MIYVWIKTNNNKIKNNKKNIKLIKPGFSVYSSSRKYGIRDNDDEFKITQCKIWNQEFHPLCPVVHRADNAIQRENCSSRDKYAVHRIEIYSINDCVIQRGPGKKAQVVLRYSGRPSNWYDKLQRKSGTSLVEGSKAKWRNTRVLQRKVQGPWPWWKGEKKWKPTLKPRKTRYLR